MLATGDETGLLKLVSTDEGCIKTYGEQTRQQAIVGLSHIDRTHFSVLRKTGVVEFWEYSKNDEEKELRNLSCIDAELDSDAAGICSLYHSNKYESSAALAYSEDGKLRIVPYPNPKRSSSSDSANVVSVDVKGPISAMASCGQGGVAYGGKENDLTFFDTNTQQVIWNAKNVPHDKLRLRVPIWITSLAFFNPEQTSLSTGTQLITGTAYKQVRIYDTRTSPRPTSSFEIGEYRVTQLQVLSDSTNVFVSDTIGNVFHYDLRFGRRLHSLKGSDGAIRQMEMYDDEGTLACVGLDRHVSWHNLHTYKHLKSVYLRNRINACLTIETESQGKKSDRRANSKKRRLGEEGDDEEEDMEDVEAFLDQGSESEGDDEDDAEEDDEEEQLEGEEDFNAEDADEDEDEQEDEDEEEGSDEESGDDEA